MALPGYGVLFGTITAARAPQGVNKHWLLIVQPNDKSHPTYRVGIRISDPHGAIQAQWQDLATGSDQAKAFGQELIADQERFPNFLCDDQAKTGLDYIRNGIANISHNAFVTVNSEDDDIAKNFAAIVKKHGVRVAIYGTATPVDAQGNPPPTGFTGVTNVHMNQGSRDQVGGTGHHVENASYQDGAIFFIGQDDVTGLFLKFASQSLDTDEDGVANNTGIKHLDDARSNATAVYAARDAAHTYNDAHFRSGAGNAARPHVAEGIAGAAAVGGAPASVASGRASFVFADANPDDGSGTYVPDNDSDVRNAPVGLSLSKGATKGRVPAPRYYPIMNLSDVIDISAIKNGSSIEFDLIGDSGASSQQKVKGEESVTERMTNDAKSDPPAFLFHLGDVVYFYGEENYYYSQFYEPFQYYPAPVFAIPGNHDGIVYNDTMVSLDPFIDAFCAAEPARWAGSGGITRTTMTQPGVYFTLDAPYVSIIGLYSNCSESLGWLDDTQLAYLANELKRLKAIKENTPYDGAPASKDAQGGQARAVILAIHHCPRWFGTAKDPTSEAIDAACEQAGFWPDAVVVGHAHLFQRFVREVGGKNIPYVVNGAGGYGLNALQKLGRGTTLKDNLDIVKLGYIRARTDGKTLILSYRVANESGQADVITIDLNTSTVSFN
jgi:hypothetical protein